MKTRNILSLVLVMVLSLITIPLCVSAQQSKAFTKVTPGSTTPLSVVPTGQTGRRTGIAVQNVGSVNVAFGGTASITYATGYIVAPSQELRCTGDTDSLFAIAQSSTADLRVIATYTQGGASSSSDVAVCTISRLNVTGITNTAAANTVPMSDGTNVVVGNVVYKMLTTAITPNSTTCSDASGSLAITSNATGKGTTFRCDGTNYQLQGVYADDDAGASLGTIATTGATSDYSIAPFAGTLTGADFSGVDALTASNTNYITFSITNLGQAGAGSNPMLAATAANTTQVTGGTAIGANTKWVMTLNGTGSNLIVAKGDRLKVTATATGTLANTVTFSKVRMYFTRLS